MTVDLIISWLLTYAAHSTLFISAAWILTRFVSGLTPMARSRLWRTALVGALVTTSLHTAFDLRAVHVFLSSSAGAIDVAADAPGRAGRPADFSLESLSTTWTAVLVLVWILSVATGALRRLRSALRYFRNLGERVPVDDRRIVAVLTQLTRSAGINRDVLLTSSLKLRSPVAIGLSEICIPCSADLHLRPDETRAVLAHELAHIKRFDPVWMIVFEMLETLFFFQPLNRLARDYAETEAEYACDLRALEWTGERGALARSLAIVARRLQMNSPFAVVEMAGPKAMLYDRVDQILSGTHVSECLRSRVLSVTLITVLVVSVAAVGPSFSGQANSGATDTCTENVPCTQRPPIPTARPPVPAAPSGIESASPPSPSPPSAHQKPPERPQQGPLSEPVPPPG